MKMMKSNRTCYEAALHLLKYRNQSEKELRRKLKDREYTRDEITKTLEKLKYYGYVNDDDLAEEVFNAYRKRHCYGISYIRQKMKMQGLICQWQISEEEERNNALYILSAKAKIVPAILSNYRKAVSFLKRRGFSYSSIIFALHELDVKDAPADSDFF